MRYQLKRTQQIYCDLATAWQFFSDPSNLGRITPASMGFTIRQPVPTSSIYTGQVIHYTITPLLGIPLAWTTRIIQVDPYVSFTDYQSKGPYAYWNHHHLFEANSEGGWMTDTVDYELPMGLIGRWTHTWIVKSKLEEIFDFRQQVLAKFFPKQNPENCP
jgi:ligand-binding SRPBCC domain-containing protein